jgi:hypothetical protein
VADGDDEIDPADEALFVDLVVMEERAPRSFAGSHTFERIRTGNGANVLRQDFGIVQQLLQALNAVEDLDEPRLMIVERTEDGSAFATREIRRVPDRRGASRKSLPYHFGMRASNPVFRATQLPEPNPLGAVLRSLGSAREDCSTPDCVCFGAASRK